MKRKDYCFGMIAILICSGLVFGLASSTFAADNKQQDTQTQQEDVLTIDDVVVRGEVVNKDLEATSATVLTNEDIVNRVYITPLDMVTLSPGVAIHQYKQGGTAANFIMRGFRGNSHGSNTAIFLDGIPLNEGDGYADTNIINPDEIEKVELIKGPSSALYGNYASAGALAFYTKKRVDGNRFKLNAGAHNTYEANFVGGLSNADWDQVYSVQTYHTDGYQANSDWDRQNAAARITRHLTDNIDLRLSLRGFNSDWDAPGYINQAQYDRDPSQAVSETNGGGKDRVAGRVDLDYQVSADSKILFNVWGYDQEFWRWYANDPTGLAPGTIVGNLRNFSRSVYGAGVSYNVLADLLRRQLRLTIGSDYMVEDIGRERWRLLSDTGREKGPKFWDYDIDMETLAFYAQGSYQVVEPLRVILGARYDQFAGDLLDHLDNDNEFSMEDQGVFSPKAGIILTVLDNRFDLFANYSEGFALLPGFSEQAAFKQDDWEPQERVQYEGGVRARPADWFKAEIVAFSLETSKDFIYDSVTDEYQNVGETTREGIEVKVDFYAFDFGYFHADYGYVDATYDSYEKGGVSLAGKTLRGVPENIYNAEIGYSPPSGLGGRLRYHYEDGFYLDDANAFESDSWDRLDTQIAFRFGNKATYMVALDIVNVLDETFADYTSGTTNKQYSPGLPLSAYLSFTMDF
ncbi:MAG: TonB-dependent receptor plug domain-containing protein [Desulfobacteraceae bacterium]|jgi:iron complex outermembrane receptor protein